MIYVFIGYCIAQLIDNFINQPLIFGNSVKSHPLEIFLVIVIAGLIFGIFGMVVAIPAYTAIKVIAKEFLSEPNLILRKHKTPFTPNFLSLPIKYSEITIHILDFKPKIPTWA